MFSSSFYPQQLLVAERDKSSMALRWVPSSPQFKENDDVTQD